MPDERASHRPRLLLAALVLLLPGLASADGVYGTFQTQYQRLDDRATLVSGSNAIRTQSLSQEVWLRTLDLHRQEYLRPSLLLESNLRLADQRFLDRGDRTSTPMGSLRLIHPLVQVLAAYEPTTSLNSVTTQAGSRPDSLVTRTVTTRSHEASLNAHVQVPKLPQIDIAWVARQRDNLASKADRNTTRNARLTYSRDRWSAYGGVNDQNISSRSAGAGRNTQQVWNGGGAWQAAPLPKVAVQGQYDFSGVRGVASGLRRPSTLSHSAGVSGDWRPEPRFVASTNYQWRHVSFGTHAIAAQTDHEGSMLGRFSPTPRSSVLGSLGVRTVRNTLPGGEASVGLQKYATASGSLDANVRRNWTTNCGLSHTTSADPGRAIYSVETMSITSRGQLVPRITVDGTMQVSANGDSGAAAARWSTSWIWRVQGTLLRSLQAGFSMRDQRNGPGLWRSRMASRGLVVDASWRPAAFAQFIAQYGSSGELPRRSGTSSATTSVSARVQPADRWQWYGSWTRSDQTVFVSSAGRLSSREIVGGRVQYEPNRRVAMSAGLTYNDPGRAMESRRFDAALTWSFGR